jgi:hypothetical protein
MLTTLTLCAQCLQTWWFSIIAKIMWRSITSQNLQALDDIREKEAAELAAATKAANEGVKHEPSQVPHPESLHKQVSKRGLTPCATRDDPIDVVCVFAAERQEGTKEESVKGRDDHTCTCTNILHVQDDRKSKWVRSNSRRSSERG